ncbi:PREDICTED: WD [Prunus dulcis]|uniref:PREDICTED: WD n=1 Tax=Prunus dulcis TaxID=3755 RepID=A0A5E4FVK0_PRUDU|nr:WD repeat-containing protein 7 isoform X1 [Prunus dulcis]VVA31479.1 PREDICTED: WD [Prunus dulcis]
MKCRSVACIWSGTPPSHRVTAAAALSHPPTLYTGGSDGSIIWWNLHSSDSNLEIVPMAMLCGHAAPIADLGICDPLVVSGSEGRDSLGDGDGDGEVSSSPHSHGALISACADGMLCVWSRSSGHCRRRRKLPPWVGSPSMVRTLPSNQRYVCIACCFVDSVHLLDHHSVESSEVGEVLGDRESQHKKPPKCTVVIVDSYTLSIVQTVFHGNLSIGSLKFMDVVSLTEDQEKHAVVMADSFGRLQLVSIPKNPHQDKEGGTGLHPSSQLEMTVCAEGLSEGGNVMSIATCGNVVAFVLKSRCIFRLLPSGNTIGEISSVDDLLCEKSDSTQSHMVGGLFLEIENVDNLPNTQESDEIFSRNFAVWNNKGLSIVYSISYSKGMFKCESLCEIPANTHPLDVRLSISFIQMGHYILRIESLCFDAEEPLQWKPHVTIWSTCRKHDDHGNLCLWFKLHGVGCSLVDWTANSTSSNESECPGDMETKLTSSKSFGSSSGSVNGYDNDNLGLVNKRGVVSSSMVISETFFAPYAVVYGFFTGEIEIVRFDLFEGLSSLGGSSHHEVKPQISRQFFLGHTGAVLCLAAHRMVGIAKGWSFNQVLVSGSMDCTVRIWDLDTGNLITVMHQHVGPVRQIILPPAHTYRPWSDCFLSVGEDSCVALASLETLRVERIFPGHPSYPAKVVWDGGRGYIVCLCRNHSGTSDAVDILYIWDVKTGARERVLRGTPSHSMFDHFCKGISMNSISGSVLNGNTSVSSLLLPVIEDGISTHSHPNNSEKLGASTNLVPGTMVESNTSRISKGDSEKLFPAPAATLQSNKHPIKSYCPFPGIAALSFDLASLVFPYQKHDLIASGSDNKQDNYVKGQGSETSSPHHKPLGNGPGVHRTSNAIVEEIEWIKTLEECLLRFSLASLHLWNVDPELDNLLITDMKLKRPKSFIVASGFQGDKGSLTLTFPNLSATLELWRMSSEFCAMRSLTMVSLAQRMISLSHTSSNASSALAAFYTRNFADKMPDIKPPLLQLLVSFWQDESKHVRMAARSLFHCAASRAIPLPLCNLKASGRTNLSSLSGLGENEHVNSNIEETSANRLHSDQLAETQRVSKVEEFNILAWLQSFEMQDWISCVGGTSQDAMTSHIIVAAALAIWYPSLVKPCLAMLVVHPLMKLVMAMNEKYSSTAAELLAEGMESTWKQCISSEIPRLIGDIFFQIECVSGPSVNSAAQSLAVPVGLREILVGFLLPSLAVADVPGFLTVMESQIWSTASDSPVHLVSLMTLIRVVRGSPRYLAQYLDKVIDFILQTVDPSNSVMRNTCFQSSMTALKEVVRAFPMVALNDTWTRLAVGDVIGERNNATIRVYDMQSVMKIKVLDASGPPGLPNLLAAGSEMMLITAISALSFSPDGEGLVAFSEHGLMIRWWSLGSVFWEKLSRNLVPVQCTKLIFVPPWEGFSPNSSRSSIMASIMGHDRQINIQEGTKGLSQADNLKLLIHNLDLSYRLEWVGERKVLLTRHGHELGTFLL